MALLLNLPLTLVGVAIALVFVPRKFMLHHKPFALVFSVKHDSLPFGYLRGWRGMTVGQTVILNPRVEDKDLEHELIHVEQQIRAPFIQPFLYAFECMRVGG